MHVDAKLAKPASDTLADLADAGKAEAAEGAFDCLALRIENAVLQRDGYTSLDHDCPS